MSLAQPSTRTMTLIIVVLAALTCTMFSLVCLGHDATVAALTVTAIIISAIGIILLTFFISEYKRPAHRQQQVVLNTVRPAREMTDRPPLPPWVFDPPAFVPPFPMPPPQIIGEDSTVVIPSPPSSPPSYEESAEIEDRRITDNSNAPPAYNQTNFVSDNNIASFSPPPFYSPPSPFFGTSVQTSTMYLSSETIAPSPLPTLPTPSLASPITIRAPSPVRRQPARKPRRSPRHPKPQETVIVMEDEQASTSSSPVAPVLMPPPAPKTSSRTPLPQMFIDCSKAEPTLFTINGEESII